ncbi:MAG: hypothetical protein FWD31_13955, partial [Planctomycetaceae bacterium]|nr:hypothetical protein [Planctomycetaceae bacterium]
MATPSQRCIHFSEIRNFGTQEPEHQYSIPDLTVLQTTSYKRFLQEDTPPKQRLDQGLEAVLREIFPIESYDKTTRLEYLYYELEKPRYEPDECRQLRLTYGKPFKVRLRLVKENEEPIDEDAYLGDLPIMLGGGEFIINGAERVVVSQLHRSPGIDFVSEMEADRKSFSCRVIPERGSWIEFHISRKESVAVRIDQSSKLPVMMLLRAMSPTYSTDADILRAFYKTTQVKIDGAAAASKIEGKTAVGNIAYPVGSEKAGEVIVECGQTITKSKAEILCTSGIKKIEVMEDPKNKLLLNSLEEDKTSTHEEALMRIYQRLRPGNPPQLEKARELFRDKFYDTNRYRLGRVGRFRINRKLGLNIPLEEMTLKPEDIVHAVAYLNRLWIGDQDAEIDDIDHLGNRRLRTIDELASEEIRKGFLKLRRTVQERMSLREEITPRQVINQKSISAAIEYFFGRGELSQVVDQTNPLSMLTHERRLSALGPGGLNRKRAGFDVRDVHSSHYGRICPIETPEGTNIGLISSLSIYAKVDGFGFLTSPYRTVKNGKLTDEILHWRADEEHEKRVAPADVKVNKKGEIVPDKNTNQVIVRYRGDYVPVDFRMEDSGVITMPYQTVKDGKLTGDIQWLRADEVVNKRVAPTDVPLKSDKNEILPDPSTNQVIVHYRGDNVSVAPGKVDFIADETVEAIDVSPSQMIGVSAGLIPFLEHDDANRALMGSNMQRQAVPLLISEPALVATGLEKQAAYNSSLLLQAERAGEVTYCDGQRIIVTVGKDTDDVYDLRKFVGLNERTCQNQVPVVRVGDRVQAKDILADGASMKNGELCLGRNVLVAFMAWDGFNFEDAIIISEDLVKKDTYTSIHIEEFDVEIRDTKLGRE